MSKNKCGKLSLCALAWEHKVTPFCADLLHGNQDDWALLYLSCLILDIELFLLFLPFKFKFSSILLQSWNIRWEQQGLCCHFSLGYFCGAEVSMSLEDKSLALGRINDNSFLDWHFISLPNCTENSCCLLDITLDRFPKSSVFASNASDFHMQQSSWQDLSHCLFILEAAHPLTAKLAGKVDNICKTHRLEWISQLFFLKSKIPKSLGKKEEKPVSRSSKFSKIHTFWSPLPFSDIAPVMQAQ